MSNRNGWLFCLAAAALLSLPGTSLGQQVALGEYPLPNFGCYCEQITAGPDGAMWFAEYGSNAIGRITVAGATTMYSVPTTSSEPFGITAGPDGALWFTEVQGKVGRITTAGTITEYAVPGTNTQPYGITAGPDGALWFTEAAGSIGRITTTGTITQYPVNTHAQLSGITAGPDGALWFTNSLNKIGRITTAGVMTEYTIPTANAGPSGITAGPDGALWFTENAANKIGRITTSGSITEYPLPSGPGQPGGITAGPDGALWFTEGSLNTFAGASIGRVTTAGAITQFPVPAGGTAPDWIALGPDGALWFTQYLSNAIGQVVLPTATLSASPSAGSFLTSLTFMGSSFAPNESVSIYGGGIGSPVLTSATADSTGAITAKAPVPPWPYGPRIFLGVGQTSGKLGAASFTMNARLILKPNSGPVGTAVTVTGYGFGSNGTVTLNWNNYKTELGVATAKQYGSFNAFTFTVPSGSSTGKNIVMALGEYAGVASAGFTVQ